jgi:hypothetical protein
MPQISNGEVNHMFPYGSVDLAHLEGFDATPYEIAITHNRGFLRFRQEAPIRFGALVLGETERTVAPSAVSKLFDRIEVEMRSLLICAAKVSRDVRMDHVAREDERNKQLLADLRSWLDSNNRNCESDSFRWERHWTTLKEQKQHSDWAAQATIEMAGVSQMVVIFTGALPSGYWSKMIDTLTARIRKLHGLSAGDEHCGRIRRYLPNLQCRLCDDPNASLHPADCKKEPMICILDCGSAREIMRLFPRGIQEFLSTATFQVPRSTFRRHNTERYISPVLLLYDLHRLTEEEQEGIWSAAQAVVVDDKSDELDVPIRSKCWTDVELIHPVGRYPNRALLAAGYGMGRPQWWVLDGRLAEHGQDQLQKLARRGLAVAATRD